MRRGGGGSTWAASATLSMPPVRRGRSGTPARAAAVNHEWLVVDSGLAVLSSALGSLKGKPIQYGERTENGEQVHATVLRGSTDLVAVRISYHDAVAHCSRGPRPHASSTPARIVLEYSESLDAGAALPEPLGMDSEDEAEPAQPEPVPEPAAPPSGRGARTPFRGVLRAEDLYHQTIMRKVLAAWSRATTLAVSQRLGRSRTARRHANASALARAMATWSGFAQAAAEQPSSASSSHTSPISPAAAAAAARSLRARRPAALRETDAGRGGFSEYLETIGLGAYEEAFAAAGATNELLLHECTVAEIEEAAGRLPPPVRRKLQGICTRAETGVVEPSDTAAPPVAKPPSAAARLAAAAPASAAQPKGARAAASKGRKATAPVAAPTQPPPEAPSDELTDGLPLAAEVLKGVPTAEMEVTAGEWVSHLRDALLAVECEAAARFASDGPATQRVENLEVLLELAVAAGFVERQDLASGSMLTGPPRAREARLHALRLTASIRAAAPAKQPVPEDTAEEPLSREERLLELLAQSNSASKSNSGDLTHVFTLNRLKQIAADPTADASLKQLASIARKEGTAGSEQLTAAFKSASVKHPVIAQLLFSKPVPLSGGAQHAARMACVVSVGDRLIQEVGMHAAALMHSSMDFSKMTEAVLKGKLHEFDWTTLHTPPSSSKAKQLSKEEKNAMALKALLPALEDVLERMVCFDSTVQDTSKQIRGILQGAEDTGASAALAVQNVLVPLLKKYSEEWAFFRSGSALPELQASWTALTSQETGDPHVKQFLEQHKAGSRGGGDGVQVAELKEQLSEAQKVAREALEKAKRANARADEFDYTLKKLLEKLEIERSDVTRPSPSNDGGSKGGRGGHKGAGKGGGGSKGGGRGGGTADGH